MIPVDAIARRKAEWLWMTGPGGHAPSIHISYYVRLNIGNSLQTMFDHGQKR